MVAEVVAEKINANAAPVEAKADVKVEAPAVLASEKPKAAVEKPAAPAAPTPAPAKVAKSPKAEETLSFVFGKWDTRNIEIEDASLANYLSLDGRVVPHTFGRATRGRFEKAKVSVVERLVNKMMRSGQGKRKVSGKYIRGRGGCGKKIMAMHTVEKAFELVERETKENPVQVLVRAIEHSAPREDTTRIKRGGISYTQAVDVAPLKRVDEALKNIALASFSSSFNKNVDAAGALAKEIVLASKEDNTSFSVKRRDEVERIAKSSR